MHTPPRESVRWKAWIGEKGLSMQRVKGTEELSMTETAVWRIWSIIQERTYSLWRYECGPGAQCGEVNSFNFFKWPSSSQLLSCLVNTQFIRWHQLVKWLMSYIKNSAVGCGIIELRTLSLLCTLDSSEANKRSVHIEYIPSTVGIGYNDPENNDRSTLLTLFW